MNYFPFTHHAHFHSTDAGSDNANCPFASNANLAKSATEQIVDFLESNSGSRSIASADTPHRQPSISLRAGDDMTVDLVGIWAIALVLLFGFFFTILFWLICRRIWVLRHVFHHLSSLWSQSARDRGTDTSQSQATPPREKRRKRSRVVNKPASRRARGGRRPGTHMSASEGGNVTKRGRENDGNSLRLFCSCLDDLDLSDNSLGRHVPAGNKYSVEAYLERDASEYPLPATYPGSIDEPRLEVSEPDQPPDSSFETSATFKARRKRRHSSRSHAAARASPTELGERSDAETSTLHKFTMHWENDRESPLVDGCDDSSPQFTEARPNRGGLRRVPAGHEPTLHQQYRRIRL